MSPGYATGGAVSWDTGTIVQQPTIYYAQNPLDGCVRACASRDEARYYLERWAKEYQGNLYGYPVYSTNTWREQEEKIKKQSEKREKLRGLISYYYNQKR